MTTAHRTAFEVDPQVPLIRIERAFDAPVSAVFRAHTDPDLVVRWLGPRGLTTDVERWDCTTGGAYRYVQRRGQERYGFHGSFHEVRPDALIVQTFTWDGAPDEVALERMTFTAEAGGTRLVTTSLVDSFASRDAFYAGGMQHGVTEGYERLDEVLRA